MRIRAETDRRVGRRRAVEEYRLQRGARILPAGEEFAGRPRALRHAVVEKPRCGEGSGDVGLAGTERCDCPFNAAFDPRHVREAAVAGDVGGLARPRRNRARTRGHDDGGARLRPRSLALHQRSVEEVFESFDDPPRGIAAANEVDPTPVEIGDRGRVRPYPLDEACAPKCRQGTPSTEQQDSGDGRGGGVHLVAGMILESHHMNGAAPSIRPPGASKRRGSIRVTTGSTSDDRRQDRKGHGTESRA